MKKVLSVILCMTLLLGVLSACTTSKRDRDDDDEEPAQSSGSADDSGKDESGASTGSGGNEESSGGGGDVVAIPPESFTVSNVRMKSWNDDITPQFWNFQVLAEVENTGTETAYLMVVMCKILAGGEDLTKVVLNASPDLVAPGEKVVLSGWTLTKYEGSGEFTTGEVTLGAIQWTKPVAHLPVTGELTFDRRVAVFTGAVTNTTDDDDAYINVSVLLYDADHTLVGVMRRILMDDEGVKAGETGEFTIRDYDLPPDVTADVIVEYEVIAYV